MAIEIGKDLSLAMALEGERIVVYFQRPKASDLVKYLATTLSAQRDDESNENLFKAELELGKSCISGVRSGDIFIERNGERTELVTEPDRPGYVENWKEIIYENCPIILLKLANHLIGLSKSEQENLEKK